MPKAEAGSLKAISNKMKSRGLTRLRWYCQICEKACRDENAYKMHCQSPSHTRKALEVGQNFKGAQEDFSRQFERDFVQLLKTAHGEKEMHANKFYQEVIANKEHVHLNATKWHSLTDFVKHLARSSICRVEEKEDGLFIAWIDDSEGAIKRREVARRKEMQDRGDEEREQVLLREQIRRARREAEARGVVLEGEGDEEGTRNELVRGEGEKISMTFGPAKGKAAVSARTESTGTAVAGEVTAQGEGADRESGGDKGAVATEDTESGKGSELAAAHPVSLKFGAKPKPKNVFKNAFAGAPKKVMVAQPKKISEAERIMKEELERKRTRESGGGPPSKKMKFQF
ncbi:domain of Kin17 curved DNA-binding protein-domain-containing protein [Schizothecium vesticola]|uniref:Domain of Kin17 curved DNA-binding protein-domain-containing protein n=1 Tax=Schizothecium vesticola TaxID=314040 RepID=A0AA40F6I6_9PEZI|nr:domain of Kin17 curved DNA-binding protein-domain-containing protein [Schizothecium vesticola]